MTNHETGFIDKMMRGVVRIEILVNDIQAKYKLSQNKSEQDYKNVIQQLEISDHQVDNKIADKMKKLKKW